VCAQGLDAASRLAGGYQQKAGEWSAAGLLRDAAPTFVAASFHGVASTPGRAGGLVLLFGAAHLSKPDESATDIAARLLSYRGLTMLYITAS
jgi:hypothetical protein